MPFVSYLFIHTLPSFDLTFWKLMKKYNCTIICHQQLNNEQETISFSKLAPVMMLKPFCLPAMPRSGIGMLNMHIIWKVAIRLYYTLSCCHCILSICLRESLVFYYFFKAFFCTDVFNWNMTPESPLGSIWERVNGGAPVHFLGAIMTEIVWLAQWPSLWTTLVLHRTKESLVYDPLV